MSVGFEIVCDTCKLTMHAGIANGCASVFGYASTDEEGRRKVAEFAFEHAYCDLVEGVRIVISDTAEKKRSDGYRDLSDSSENMAEVALKHADAHKHAFDSFLTTQLEQTATMLAHLQEIDIGTLDDLLDEASNSPPDGAADGSIDEVRFARLHAVVAYAHAYNVALRNTR